MNEYGPVEIDNNGVAVPGSVLRRLQYLESRVAELEARMDAADDWERQQNERNA